MFDRAHNGQAKPQWAGGTTVVQRKVDAADDSGKTVEPIVGLSEWLYSVYGSLVIGRASR